MEALIATVAFAGLMFLILLVASKSAWDTLRRARDVPRRLDELEAGMRGLQSEWTDTLDIMTRREERMRKRDSRALKGGPDPSPEAPAVVTTDRGPLGKDRLRALVSTGTLKPRNS